LTADPSAGWQRTSPTAVIIMLGGAIKALATHGAPALVPLAAAFASVEKLKLWWLLLAIPPIAVLMLVWSVLSYLRFQFRLEGGVVLVRRGVLQRERITIEFERVQNVSITEPFFMRPLGLAVLGVDTAGSQNKEITLAGIRKPLAQQMRTAILESRKQAKPVEVTDDAAETVDDDGERLLIERSVPQIMRHGLTARGLLIYLAGLLGIVALFVLSLPLLSIAGALIRHYGFRLTREGDTYRRVAGLINRQEQALRQHKIQAVRWRENVIARAMKLVTLEVEVATSGSAEQQAAASGIPMGVLSTFTVPALTPEEAVELTRELLPDCDAGAVDYSMPNRWRLVGRKLLLFFTPPILAVSLPFSIFVHPLFLIIVPIACTAFFLILRQSWKRQGYAVRGGHGFVRSGFLGFTTQIFPLFKMQRVALRQTPGQRRAGVAHLTLHLASGSMTLPHIAANDAHRLQDLTLYEAESTDRAWY
jgi:putative membrane protein